VEIGIIGLPGSGKTTLLNALTKAHAETGAFGGGGGARPNLGVVKIPDPRLDAIVKVVQPKRVVQAELSFVDVPGQPPELGRSKGIQGQYLLEVTKTDALLLVVRAFASPALPEPTPEDDLATMEMEMTFADLAVVGRRLQRVEASLKSAKASEREAVQKEMELLGRLKATLEGGKPIRSMDLTPDEEKALSGFTFLTTKPLIIALNVGEDGLSRVEEVTRRWQERHSGPDSGCIALSARLEEELAQLDEEEAKTFRESLGAPEDLLGRLVRLAQGVAGLITFYTAGPEEVRAWQLEKGLSAPRAAGKIHSDLERGFIRAETIAYDDFLAAGSFAEARKRGTLRQEGKGYIVQDGDVITFLFSVSGR
jgi:GTP-binding protein YchF